MRWNDAIGAHSDGIARIFVGSINEAYAENVDRFDPDGLGDDNVVFGVAVSRNLRHLLERDLEHLVDLGIDRSRGRFALLLPGGARVYFYKAPPGARSIEDLRLDDSQTKIELAQANAGQLELAFDHEDVDVPDASHLDQRLVVVHFGDPVNGLSHVEIGKPVAVDQTGLATWEWSEPLEPAAADDTSTDGRGISSSEGADEDFGLRLRKPGMEDQTDSAQG